MPQKPTYEDLQLRIRQLEEAELNRQQTVKVLQNSKVEYDTIVDLANDGLVIIKDGTYQYVSEAWARTTGYTVKELTGENASDLVVADKKQTFIDRCRARLAGEPVDTVYETQITCKDGTIKDIEVSLGTVHWEDDTADLAVVRDITKRKRVEVQLQQKVREQETFINNIPHMAWLKDRDSNFILANQAFADAVGMSTDYLKNNTCAVCFGEELAGQFKKDDTRVLQDGKKITFEETIIDQKNNKLFLETTKSPIFGESGEIIGTVGIATNITKRKLAEEALRESESKYSAVVEQANDGLVVIKDTEYQYANQAWARTTGYQMEELQKKTLVDLVVPDEKRKILERHLAHMAGESVAPVYETQITCKDGAIKDVEVSAATIDWKGGIADLAVLRDITKRKQAEATARQLQKSESLVRMAGAVAHRYNNLLAIVMGNMELALLTLPKDSKAAEEIRAAMAATRSASNVSDLMLAYLGQTVVKRQPLDLSFICREFLAELRVGIPQHVILSTDMPETGTAVMANAGQIHQALKNLIINAWDALDEQPGTISVSLQTSSAKDIPLINRRPVEFQPEEAEYARLTISDSGCGMAQDIVDKLFDPFFSTKFSGRGLGMAVTLGTLKTHQGCITVESKPGQGSTFQVFLPLTNESVRSPKTDTQTESAATRPTAGTVLVVEEEPSVRQTSSMLLDCLDLNVLEAKNGVEAVSILKKHQRKIHCVLCNLTMTRMGGWETIEALRKIVPDIPVILTSGYDRAHVMDGHHEELPQAFLGKPYTLASLKVALARATKDTLP